MDIVQLTGLAGLLPEPWRTYVNASLFAVSAVIVVSSTIAANTPAWAFKRWRLLRVFSFISAAAPRDGAGTMKLPFTEPTNPGAMEDLAKLRAAADRLASMTAPHNLGASLSPDMSRAVREVLGIADSRETMAPPSPKGGA